MKRLFLVFMLVSSAGSSWAQKIYSHQSSDGAETARYQIIQSEMQTRLTFRLDKYTGQVFQLVKGKDGLTWQAMIVEDHPYNETNTAPKVNYQIFISGIAVAQIFLLNVNSGATWQLAEDKKLGQDFWHAMKE